MLNWEGGIKREGIYEITNNAKFLNSTCGFSSRFGLGGAGGVTVRDSVGFSSASAWGLIVWKWNSSKQEIQFLFYQSKQMKALIRMKKVMGKIDSIYKKNPFPKKYLNIVSKANCPDQIADLEHWESMHF